jgi:hypothetical protein
MSVVAVTGLMMSLILAGVRLKERHDYFLCRSQLQSELEIECQRLRDSIGRAIGYKPSLRETAELREMLARLDQEIPYHSAMARKYWHAARCPWLPIESDPPEPGRNW